MKTIKFLLIMLISCTVTQGNAQFLKKLKKSAQEAAERTVERKVERKTEQETGKTFDSIFDNQGGLLNGKKEAPAKTYAFTHAYEMDIIAEKDTTHVTYYLTNVDEFMGSALQMNENEQMITVMDLPRKTAYNFMDFGANKSMMSFGLDFEKVVENQTDKDVLIEATGNTKEILGFECEEYKVAGEDFNGTIWVTHDAEISFSDAFGKTQKNKNKGVNQAWMSMVEGLTMEMNMTDTSKKKAKKIKMQCTEVNPTDYIIYTSDYENSF
ncbi:MAG: DUF4412 domain-containing protein [Maribacter sp.]|uniref:DUF4412 domain-containing protein n=1 Tax=Maribacter sp. TaxID=1897614 RepID=UPI003C73EB26